MENDQAEKKRRFSEAFRKHFVDGSYGKGSTIQLYLKTVEATSSSGKCVSVVPMDVYISANYDFTFELMIGSNDDGLFVDGRFEENGTIDLDQYEIGKMVEYYKKDGDRGIREVDFRDVVELSIIGVDLKTAVGFADLINAIYGTKITKDNLKITGGFGEQAKKLGILNKDFEELRIYSEGDDDFESETEQLAKYGDIFYDGSNR